MTKTNITLLCFLISNFLIPNLVSADICSPTTDSIQGFLRDPLQRIGFRNDGGLQDGGTCWWHSRLQRAAAYLVVFNPEAPKPSPDEVIRILDDLAHLRRVVEISGFRNFREFTIEYRELVQNELNQWQLRDGFINQSWVRGLSGHAELNTERLHQRLKKIQVRFAVENRPQFLMLQMPGIVSHSILLLGVKPWGLNGMAFEAIDSNYPSEISVYAYEPGWTSIARIKGDKKFSKSVPYMGFNRDYRKIERALQSYCRP